MKIAILSSYTVDFVREAIAAKLEQAGVESTWYMPGFDQYHREIVDPASGLVEFNPDFILLLLTGEVLMQDPKRSLELLTACSARFSSATILVHNAIETEPAPLQLLNWNNPTSARRSLVNFNLELAAVAESCSNVFVVDFESAVRKLGSDRFFDSRMRYLAKLPFSEPGIQAVADQLSTAIHIAAGGRKKCLVLDLDNTLWGGVLGEDGIEHIRLSNDGEGKAFYDFQRAIEKLSQSGVLLAVCSKNDDAQTREAITSHPYMVLKLEQFAAIRINWADKSENLKSIADELNIGLDTFVFLDDSPQEREEVRQLLPDVVVPDLPDDPADYTTALCNWGFFEALGVTEADRQRGKSYYQERRRSEERHTTASLEDYLSSLAIELTIRTVDDFSIPRAAQLTQRTNQFNLTTRRYTDSEVRAMREDPNIHVFTANSSDRFGDSGLIALAIVEQEGDSALLDTFLASCRILGRGIETAFLRGIETLLRQAGVNVLHAEFLPTDRNAMAASFLPDAGFTPIDSGHYQRELEEEAPFPQHIAIHYES